MKALFLLTIPGDPVAKGRPRVVNRPNSPYPVAITPEKTRTAENWIRQCALDSMAGGSRFPLDVPLVLEVVFYLRRPKKPKHEAPARRPDLDNLVKCVTDGMQLAGVYTDDARIVRIEAEKRWAVGEPRIEVLLLASDPVAAEQILARKIAAPVPRSLFENPVNPSEASTR